jgi:hypothetical protein
MPQILKVIKSTTVTDAILTATSVAEADHAAWSGATTYAAGDRVILTSTHKVYESLQAGNLNKAPATETLWWLEVSPTNRWKMLDLSSTTQTVIDASDYYEFTPGQAVNALSLINISGILSVRVRMTDPSFGVVYDQTADLTDVPSEASWYAWFFEPRTEQNQFVVSDLPSYPNAVLRIDLTSSGTAYVGACAFGNQRSIGMGVQHGVRLGITDYSRKERNAWGDTELVVRAFSKRMSIDTMIHNSELDNTYSLLTDLRATPCLWIISDTYNSLSLWGFFSDFEITIAYAYYSDVSISLESLT